MLFGAKPKVMSDNKKVYERNMTHNVTDLLRIKESCNIQSSLFLKKIEKNEMGGACSVYGGEKRCIQGFGGET